MNQKVHCEKFDLLQESNFSHLEINYEMFALPKSITVNEVP